MNIENAKKIIKDHGKDFIISLDKKSIMLVNTPENAIIKNYTYNNCFSICKSISEIYYVLGY